MKSGLFQLSNLYTSCQKQIVYVTFAGRRIGEVNLARPKIEHDTQYKSKLTICFRQSRRLDINFLVRSVAVPSLCNEMIYHMNNRFQKIITNILAIVFSSSTNTCSVTAFPSNNLTEFRVYKSKKNQTLMPNKSEVILI